MRPHVISGALFICLLGTQAASGAIANLGYISFDRDNPTLGQTSFTIYNLTGNSLGCGADFPICDAVSVDSATLSVAYRDPGGTLRSLTRQIAAPLLPGSVMPFNFIFDAALINVTGAELRGKTSPGTFLLADGSVFRSTTIFDAVVDTGGTGTGLIQLTSVASTSTPEPSRWFIFLAPALLAIVALRPRRSATGKTAV